MGHGWDTGGIQVMLVDVSTAKESRHHLCEKAVNLILIFGSIGSVEDS